MCETQMEDISVIDVQRINPSHFEMVFSNSDRNKLHSYSRSMCNQSEKLSTINIQVAVNAVWTLRSIAQVWSYINNNQTGWALKKKKKHKMPFLHQSVFLTNWIDLNVQLCTVMCNRRPMFYHDIFSTQGCFGTGDLVPAVSVKVERALEKSTHSLICIAKISRSENK